MSKLRFSFLVRILRLVSVVVLGLCVLFGQVAVGQPIHLSVVNVDTGLSYFGV